MRYLLLFLSFTMFIGCSKKANKLTHIKEINSVFTESEIEDLEVLFDFFNNSICNNKIEYLTDCYYDFFDKVKTSADSGSLYLHIPIEDQLALYDQLNDSTFYQIWAIGKSWNHEDTDDTLKSVYYRWDGKFFEFLKQAGKQNEFAKAYLESVEAAGSPPPSLVASITYNYKELGIEDLRVKFILAIHFLTLNDEYKREEKYHDA
ncbi:MAG: hypothetical protein WD048_02320 [Chitinophagales bacterium]